MNRNPALTERLRALLAQITSLTASGSLRWEKQARSSHRYAKWNHTLLILGPSDPIEDYKTPRYLHITLLFEPQWQEISSNDPDLRDALLALVYAVEAATVHQPPTDPSALTDELMRRFNQ